MSGFMDPREDSVKALPLEPAAGKLERENIIIYSSGVTMKGVGQYIM